MGIRGDNLYRLRETDYASPPGETLQDLMEEQGLTQRDLARRADLSPKHVNQLLHGLVSLSPAVAQRLELVTGMPARMWNQLEALYQSDRPLPMKSSQVLSRRGCALVRLLLARLSAGLLIPRACVLHFLNSGR